MGKIRFRTPIKEVVFSYFSRIRKPQSLSQQQFFSTQILSGHVTRGNQDRFPNNKRGRGEK